MPTEKSQQIVNVFSQYIKTQNAALIKEFKLEDIKFALVQYHADKNFPFYKAMEMRIKELEGKESKNVDEKMLITEGDIQKHTPKQILKILLNLSLGAWLWIIGIMGALITTVYQIGLNNGFNKGKTEEITSGHATSLHGLTVEQLILLREIWIYQKANKLNKVIIDKEGFVLDDAKEEKTKINLAEKALGDRGYPLNFQKLMVSMPAQFLRLIPETRWGSPYVVTVPEDIGKILDKN